MQGWRTWQYWVAAAAGLYAVLSPLWTPMGSIAAMVLVSGGAMIVVAAVFALGTPIVLSMDWFLLGLGFALLVSPWVFLFSDVPGAAFTAWITGLLTLVVSAIVTMQVYRARKRQAQTPKPKYGVL